MGKEVIKREDIICKCEKKGCKFEGTWGQVPRHIGEARKRGENGHMIILVDRKSGEILREENGEYIRALPRAQSLGLVEGKPGERKTLTVNPSSALKGKISPEEVLLDSRLKFLFEWDRVMVPSYQGSFSQWIFDCIMGFHIQNKNALKLDLLFKEAS